MLHFTIWLPCSSLLVALLSTCQQARSQGAASGCASVTWRHPLGITCWNRICSIIYVYINVPKERIGTHTVTRYTHCVHGLATGLLVHMDTVRIQTANERTKYVLSICIQQRTNTHAYIQLCSVVLVLSDSALSSGKSRLLDEEKHCHFYSWCNSPSILE